MALLRSLTERDRRLLGVGAYVAVVISIVLFVDVPLYSRGRQLEKTSAEERQRLASVMSLGRDYLSVKTDLDGIRTTAFSGSGASLSGLDAIVVKAGLKKKMASVKATTKPIADGVKAIKAEMSFERISLADLSGLIGALEADGHPIAVERILIKATYEDPAAFNATLIANTVERE
jgi:hypothetical protein